MWIIYTPTLLAIKGRAKNASSAATTILTVTAGRFKKGKC
jgi:hypothetical protein